MNLTLPFAIILTVSAIIMSAIFSGTEIAYVQSSKVRIGIDASRGGLIGRILARFSHSQNMFISTLLVGNNIVLVIYGIAISVIINPVLEKWLPNEGLVLACNTLLSTFIILLTGEFLPKTIFRINPNAMLKVFALPMWFIYVILYPISLFTTLLSHLLLHLFGIRSKENGQTKLTIDQIDHYIQQSITDNENAPVMENEVKIFRNAIDFKDTHIHDCMIPRNEIVAVDICNTTEKELRGKFISTGLSKIVVYEEEIDNVKGYIHVAEMFTPGMNWKECLKPVLYTPETMLANKMMRRLLNEKKSMAIVVDEFGGTAGLVTLEDLVEEIFGEIQDEHDRTATTMRKTGKDSYEMAGRAEIEAVNEAYGLGLKESDEYQTIAGLILHEMEALPAVGDTIRLQNMEIKILSMSGPRIEMVSLSIIPEKKVCKM